MFRKFNKLSQVVMLSKKVVLKNLSAEALGCLVYISCTHEDGETIRLAQIIEKFCFGDSKWRRISRELREAGILKLERSSTGSRLTCVDY